MEVDDTIEGKTEDGNGGKDFCRATLLVIHGDAARCDRLDEELSARGYRVFTAEDGNQGLEMLAAFTADLALLGMEPSCPGAFRFLSQTKSDPGLRRLPVVMTPAPGEMDGLAAYVEAGADDWLILPADPVPLHVKIDACLDHRRLKDLERRYRDQVDKERRQANELYNLVVPAGVALSAEKDFARLLERVLLEAKRFCNADGGTLYLQNESDQLEFMMFHNDSMDIRQGGAGGQPIRFPPLALHDPATGAPNHDNIATFAALTGQTLNVPDAYDAVDFDFSGARRFDEAHGYRSMSFLTLPLRNARGRTLGVLQLINAQDRETGRVIPFPRDSRKLMESFALLATVAIESYDRTQGLRQELQHLREELGKARQTA